MAIGDSHRNGARDLTPAKHHRLDWAAHVRHQCVEPTLVIHIEVISTKFGEQPDE